MPDPMLSHGRVGGRPTVGPVIRPCADRLPDPLMLRTGRSSEVLAVAPTMVRRARDRHLPA